MNSGLQVYNEQVKLAQWTQVVSRGRGVGCLCGSSARRMGSTSRRKVYAVAQSQHESCFANVTPVQPTAVGGVTVTVRIAGAVLDIHFGAHAATVEAVLRTAKSC